MEYNRAHRRDKFNLVYKPQADVCRSLRSHMPRQVYRQVDVQAEVREFGRQIFFRIGKAGLCLKKA